MNLTLSVCVVQAMTDFVDRMIVLAVVLVILPAVSSAFRQSFYEKQKIICTNSTKNPKKFTFFLQDSHILA